MKYQISINKMVTEDNYEEGEVGMTADYGEIITLHADSLEEVPLKTAEFLGVNVDELYVFENRIELNKHETAESLTPTENQKALWKEEKFKLWNANYSCYITSVWSQNVTTKQLTELGMKEY